MQPIRPSKPIEDWNSINLIIRKKVDMKIVVWGLKGCGKTSFLKKLIHDTFEKVLYKRGFYSILFDSLKYSITFYEAPDSEEFFEQCIDISRESDGIIFAYDISKEFPIKYFNDIINCIENDKKNLISILLILFLQLNQI